MCVVQLNCSCLAKGLAVTKELGLECVGQHWWCLAVFGKLDCRPSEANYLLHSPNGSSSHGHCYQLERLSKDFEHLSVSVFTVSDDNM